MKTTRSKNKKPTAPLCKKADAPLRKRMGKVKPEALSAEETCRLIHELQTLRTELGIRNDELRNTQISLEEAKSRYADLFESAPVGYFTLDRNGLILEANLTGASMVKVERTKLFKSPFKRFVSKGHQDTFHMHRQKVFETGERQTCEIELKRKDGTVFYAAVESLLAEGRLCRTMISDITGRKRAEERTSQLASFPKLNPNPVLELATSGEIVFSNAATREILEDLGMDKDDASVFFPHDINGILKDMKKKKELSLYREVTIKDKVFGESVYLAPQFNAVRIYAFDITERKRAEEALRDSEKRLQRAQEISHLGSWELDVVNNLLTWSDEVYRIFGLQPREFGATYEAFLEAVHPDDRAAVDAAYSSSMKEGRDTYEIEHRVVRKSSGEIRYVHEKCQHYRDETGRIIRSAGMVHDITERRQAEEALRKSNSFNQSIVDSSNDCIKILDLEGRLQYMSPGGQHLLGVKDIGIYLNVPYEEFWKGVDHQAALGAIHKAKQGRSGSFQGFCPTADGTPKWWDVVITPIVGADGKPESLLAVSRNITERRQAEESLQRALRESEQRQSEIYALLRASRIVLERREFQDTARSIFDLCKNLTGASAGYVALLSKDGAENEVLFLDSGGLPCDVDPSLPMPVRGLREVAYRAGKTVFDNDFSNSEWMRFMPDGHVTLENVLFAPLIIQGRAVGILGLGNKPGGFTENDAAMASAFGELAAIALHRNRLIEALQKSRDGLEIKVQERTAELLEKSRILKRINRLYSVLSKVNEAIVRIREPEKLYEQVCRIAVEDGSFKMAWIGLTDPETSEVKPVVSYGDTGGYLDEIIIYADDVPEGRGPTGRAVFEDKCFICDDVEEDLIMRPWRDRALRHGFRSSAAFPLHAGSSVIGAFTIYAGTPQFFSDGEISLLSSLVEDISFAIDVMANERKRVEAEGRLSLFNKLINQSSDFVFIVDAGQGCIIEVNDATCDTLGYRREEMLALKVEDISEGMVDYTVWREHVSEIAEIGQMLMEDRLRRKDGTTFPVEVNVKYTEHEKKDYLVAIVRDITGRKEIEDRISVTNAVLKLFVQKITRSEYLDSVVEILRKWSRCFSVGIRSLDERGHIPYESFTGFSQEFIDSESNLSVGKDQCACIRVITGKPDPWDMAFMTRGGSFYFNNAFELSGGLSDAEKSRFCSMCVRYGFKSLAIVPVRYHEKVIGVIHLADDTEGMLPLTRVEFIETLAPIIGEAICSFNAAEELRRSQEEMRSLTAHLQEVREAERTAISREIHDELGQIMTALKIDLSWIKNKYSDHMLLEKTGAMMSLVDSTIQTIKRIITELRPNILEHLGLIPALEWQAEEFQRITGIPCDFICTTSEIVLEKNISIHIFRIFQEILTNIARHAGATNVDVYLELGDDHLILNVADNGKGITEGKISNSSSFGIMGMRERAYSIGGDLKIVGIPQKGTTITLTVPVQNCVSS